MIQEALNGDSEHWSESNRKGRGCQAAGVGVMKNWKGGCPEI